MMIRYQIIDWQRIYEKSDTRQVDTMKWCSIPTKRGLSRGLLLKYQHGPAMYGCFLSIVLNVCAKHRPPRDGWLTNDGTPAGRPLSVNEINMLTDMPVDLITLTLETLSDGIVAWLRRVPVNPESIPTPSGLFPDNIPTTLQDITGHNRESGASAPPPATVLPVGADGCPPRVGARSRRRGPATTRTHAFEHSPYFDRTAFAAALPDWTPAQVDDYYDRAVAASNKGHKYKDWSLAVKTWSRRDQQRIAKPGHPAGYTEREDNRV